MRTEKYLCIFFIVAISTFVGCRSAGDQWEITAEEAIRRGLIDPNQVWKLDLREPEPMKFDPGKQYIWILNTNKGIIKIKLRPDVAPAQVTNTIFLTNSQFYNDLVIGTGTPDAIVQGGGPLKNGFGGPGYRYTSTISKDLRHADPDRYMVGSIKHNDNTYGSEFYLTFKPAPQLDDKHALFGEVMEGKEVVDSVGVAGTAEGKSQEAIRIVSASIEIVILPPDPARKIETFLPPANVTATNTDVDRVLIKWEAIAKATEYRIVRVGSGGDGYDYASEWQNTTSYADQNARPGAKYYYRVQARSGTSVSQLSSPVAGHRPIPNARAERLPFEVY